MEHTGMHAETFSISPSHRRDEIGDLGLLPSARSSSCWSAQTTDNNPSSEGSMEGAEGREGGKASGAEGLLSTQLEMLLDHQERKLARSLSSRRKSEEDLQVRKYQSLPMTHRAKQEGWNIPTADIEIQERLHTGQGVQDVAFKARWNRMEVVVVAHSSEDGKSESEEQMQDLAILASNRRHPNLVLFLGACIDVSPALLVYEQMGSTVHEMMRKRGLWKKVWLPPTELLLRWSQHLMLALAFLHGRDSATETLCEITPMNLFPSQDLQTLKLGNLGFSSSNANSRGCKDGKEASRQAKRRLKVRSKFASPETLQGTVSETKESQVFSAAAVIWYMTSGKVARSPADIAGEKNDVSADPLRESRYSPVLQGLIRRALAADPTARPTAEDMAHALKGVAQDHQHMQRQSLLSAMAVSRSTSPHRKSSLSKVVGASPEWVRNILGEF